MGYHTHSTNEGPICPYCNEENNSVGNDYWAERQGDGATECSECGESFRFLVEYTTNYYGYKRGAD